MINDQNKRIGLIIADSNELQDFSKFKFISLFQNNNNFNVSLYE